MTRFALQPRWLAWHLLLVVVLVSFGWLGRWQLSTFEARSSLATSHARPAAGPVALDVVTRPGGRLARADVGRRVQVSGTYDPARTLLVPGRRKPGGTGSGLLVVAALRTADGVLPVVRGWVPRASSAALATPGGAVRVAGRLQPSEESAGAPVVTDRGRLGYVATVTLLDAWPYPSTSLYDGYLAAGSETPDTAPTTAAGLVRVTATGPSTGPSYGVARWRNLAYALQWWFFAAAAVVYWWVLIRRAWREQQEQEEPLLPEHVGGPPLLAAPRRTT